MAKRDVRRCYPRRAATGVALTVLAASLAAAITLVGCQADSERESSGQTPREDAEAQRVADAMLAAYRHASTYSDTAFYVQKSILRGEGVERETPWFQMSLQFARPDRLRLRFQEIRGGSGEVAAYDIANNGALTRSTMPGYPDQVHEADSPPQITLENFMPAEQMRKVLLMDSISDMFPQLAMLLSDDDSELVFPNDSNPRLLESADLRGRPCFRLATDHPSGQRVLWIDHEDYRLHRMELPIEGQGDLLDPTGRYMDLSIFIDVEQSAIDAQIQPNAFDMEVAENVYRVNRLVDPAPPAPPKILGARIGSTEFTDLEKSSVALSAFRDVTTVLEFWKIDCAPCRAQTPFLQEAADHFADRKDVAFRAVSIDSPLTPDARVAATWKSWGAEIPLLRDRTGESFADLDVRMTPTLLILGPDQRVQYVHIGAHASAKPLIDAVSAVASGEDLAAKAQATRLAALKERRQRLKEAAITEPLISVDAARAEIAPSKLPEKWRLESLHGFDDAELQRPGNVAVVKNADGTSILIIDGGQAVIELSVAGEPAARHELPEHGPQDGGVLRTAVDGDGRRWYAVSGVGWQKSYVYDDQWRRQFEFPSEGNPGVGSIALLGNGQRRPQLVVGFWGGWGIHGVGMDGERRWADRTLSQVLQLTPGPREEDSESIWCVGERGTITEYSPDGKIQRELTVGEDPLMHAAVADLGEDGTWEFCGLSLPEFGHYRAVVFGADGRPIAEHQLPRGEYSTQVQRIQPVTMPDGRGGWMIAAPDGSLRWLGANGELLERFDTGLELTGAAMTNSADGVILVVSSPEAAVAWRVQPLVNNSEATDEGQHD